MISCCAYCDNEYGVGGAFVGVPIVLGGDGIEKIIELDLNDNERNALKESVDHVKQLVTKVDDMI